LKQLPAFQPANIRTLRGHGRRSDRPERSARQILLPQKENVMKMHPNVKPILWGVAGGAVALGLIGFSWGGWKTPALVRDMMENSSRKAVIVALTPFCVEKFQLQTDAPAILGELKKLASYDQGAFVEKAGWATFGRGKPNSNVARACADALISAPPKPPLRIE